MNLEDAEAGFWKAKYCKLCFRRLYSGEKEFCGDNRTPLETCAAKMQHTN